MLGAEHDPPQVDIHDPVVHFHRDIGERTGVPDAGHVEHRVDLSKGVEGGGEHRLDLVLLGDVASKRHHCVTELLGGLLFASADVGGEHPGSLPHEGPRRRPSHPRSRAGDDRDLAVQLHHVDPPEGCLSLGE